MSALLEHLDQLVQWLDKIGLQPPSRSVRIVEVSDNDAYRNEGRLRVMEPSAYGKRFDELLTAGYSWLNLECWGVHDCYLVVAVRVPSRTVPRWTDSGWSEQSRELHPGCATAVNFSGPIRAVTDEKSWDIAPWLADCEVSLTTD